MSSCSGLLVQSRCGEGGALQTNVTGLCGEHSWCSGHTGFAPTHGCVLSPSTLLRLPAALCGAGPVLLAVPVFGYSTKALTRLGLRFVPSPAKRSGSQELDKPLSPGAVRLIPSAAPALVSTHTSRVRAPCVCSWELASKPRPSWLMSTIQNLRKSLVRNWRAVCSVVGDATSGAEFAPFPSPLPPSFGGGWAGPQPASSSLELLSPFALRMAGSVFGPVNLLSLLLSHSLSCYLTLAPSGCPQGTQARSLP